VEQLLVNYVDVVEHLILHEPIVFNVHQVSFRKLEVHVNNVLITHSLLTLELVLVLLAVQELKYLSIKLDVLLVHLVSILLMKILVKFAHLVNTHQEVELLSVAIVIVVMKL
jgi:hypothetical protein